MDDRSLMRWDPPPRGIAALALAISLAGTAQAEGLPEKHIEPPVTVGGEPRNADAPPLLWKWRRFNSADYAVTASAAALTLATSIISPSSRHALSGGVLFDDAARDALRAKSLAARYQYRDASEVGLSVAVTWPIFVDALTTAWWYRGSRDVAEQMALIDLQALTVSAALQGITNTLVGRERPYGRDCGNGLLSEAEDCLGDTHYRSFFSGHATYSFTGAALICAHHFENDLLGEPWDALSCAGGYAVAAATATFRVVGDMHYASDVLTGALVGTLVGYGVPFLHYGNPNLLAVRAGTMKMQFLPAPAGATVVGTF